MAIQAQISSGFVFGGCQDLLTENACGLNNLCFNLQQHESMQRIPKIIDDHYSISQIISAQIENQKIEIDHYINSQNERLRMALQEQRKQQLAVLVKKYESKMESLMKRKEEEILKAANKNMELLECVKRMEMERQAWQRLAQEKEAMAASLNTTIQRLREAASSGAAEDAESVHACKSLTMESLIYSNSIPFKLHRASPRFSRLHSPRKLVPPSAESRRFSPLSSALHSPYLLVSPKPTDECSKNKLFFCVGEEKSRFLTLTTQKLFHQPKVFNIGKVLIISALVLASLHPAFMLPAFASVPNAGGATGSSLVRCELFSSAWTGFLAGCLHTLSGPDHLAALAPLSIGRTRMESAAVGALWGCGHDTGQVIFGLVFLLLKDQLQIEVIRNWGTRVVGVTLLVIGAMGIREASEVPAPCVEYNVGGYEAVATPSIAKIKKKVGFGTFATGIVHGLQPDALMMILPALALPSRLAGAAFLVMFLVGTVIAMGSYTVFISSCSEALKDRVPRVTEKLTWASSLVAIALGLAIIISQLFGFSLY
ncbi:high-affinity nickel-transport family protein [Perilla frutescens var. hirtella]|uniref:High-affinity nickel-transport family protein n=1 Tax=Perilla frutescens var. hirtella TaxID=608512 RepID=A0AAD4PB73_PERFH|nr:high-affinity nickel-transport family protein [Perilla frutescens var. hirtella]